MRKEAVVGRVLDVLATEEGLEAFFFSLWREGMVIVVDVDAVWSESEAGAPGMVVEEESANWCKQRDEDGRMSDSICRYYSFDGDSCVCVCWCTCLCK